MANNNNSAKFFCENCGSEVPENAKLCKKCGKFFISVRCPCCGATGSSKDFEKGCPQCGYAGNKKNSHVELSTVEKAKALSQLFSNADSSISERKQKHSDPLPIWIYAVTLTLLALVISGLYSCMK